VAEGDGRPVSAHVARCAACSAELTVRVEVDLTRVEERLSSIERAIHHEGNRIMAGQQDIDDAVAAIGAAVGDLTTQNTAIQDAQAKLDQEIQALEAQVAAGGTVDTTALVAAGQALASATAALDTTVTNLSNDPNVPPAPVV